MPDRAVVDFVAEWIENQDLSCVDTAEELAYNWRGDMQRLPAPRALVAISPDRQWLVVLEDGDWRIRKRSNDEFCLLDEAGGGWIIDIGQSAEAVLAQWLEGRDAHR